MNFLCPSCRTPLPHATPEGVVPCTRCGVQVDLTRMDTAPGTARLWPDLDLAGESLGAYRLTLRLAAGGMGVVYEAEGPAGPCAVKVLSALLAAEPELRTRFRREAAALRAIGHPGVVRIFEEGEERGFCWYAMERVPGKDLRARIAEGPLLADEVEALARALLATLAHVHEKGFVHRDLKPGNILLSPQGPKLCDFGIARFDGSSTLTESAAVLGSLRYMAPEQRLGRTDLRSDLYALGVVLYEALAKGVPGEAELPKGVPARLRRFIARLLAERPLDRPIDARAALRELDRRRPGVAVVGAGTATLLVVGAAVGWMLAGPPAVTARVEGKDSAPVVQANAPAEPAQKEPPQEPVQVANEEPVKAQQAPPQQAEPAQVVKQPLEGGGTKNAAATNALDEQGTKGLGTLGTRGTKLTPLLGTKGAVSTGMAKPLGGKPSPKPEAKPPPREPKAPPAATEQQGDAAVTKTAPAQKKPARKGKGKDLDSFQIE